MKDTVTTILSFVLIVIIVGILLALPVMLLWNWVIPDIFGLPMIDFWHALGLSLLSSCLFNFNLGSSRKKER